MANELQVVTETVMAAQPFFEAVDNTPEATAHFNREAGFAIQIISASDYLRKISIQARQSVIDAVTNVAAIGLTLNPAQKLAYLVPRAPRKGSPPQVCLDISYIGLIALATREGAIHWGTAELVHANDLFELQSVDEKPVHKRNPFAPEGERGPVVGAYVVAQVASGAYLTTTMTTDAINDIRDRSEAWKNGQEGRRGPWESDWGEMAKKTVIKRASKLWPKAPRLDQAIQMLNDGGEGLPAIENYNPLQVEDASDETRRSRTLARLDRPMNRGGVGAERAKVLRAAAGECVQKWLENDEMAAYAAIEWLEDQDEKEIVWAILAPHSTLRSAIKRLDKEARDRQTQLDQDAAALATKLADTQAGDESLIQGGLMTRAGVYAGEAQHGEGQR